MPLTLDGNTTLPAMGGHSGMGVGAGALGGGIVGLLLGGLLGNNGNGGLFGGGNNNEANEARFEGLSSQIAAMQDAAGNALIDAGITSVNQNISGTSRDTLNSIANLSTAAANANFTTLSSINGLGRDLTASATQALINNLQNFNNLQGTLTTSTNQIIAGQNAQAAAMANCCCEIKGMIAADGNQTRALINDLNVQNLRDQLAAANNKVSNNEQNQYLLSTLIAHLKPVVV